MTWNRKANGYRLPTEAEWEYAARGGKKSGGFRFAGSNDVDEVAQTLSNTGGAGVAPVASKKENELGIFDMSGNVSEWCWDLYGKYSDKDQVDPDGAAKGEDRVFRGGDTLHVKGEAAVTARRYVPTDYLDSWDGKYEISPDERTGIRVVRSIEK